MDAFERFANWLSDNDAEWWPFLFMRPEHHQKMGSFRVLVIAALYGLFAGFFVDAWVAIAGYADRVNVLTFPLGITATLFVMFRFTLAWAWNRRAARMTATRPTLEAWRKD